jgi:hypothetical protein
VGTWQKYMFLNHRQKKKMEKTCSGFRGISEVLVRRTIYSFCIIDKSIPRVESLRIKLQETINFRNGEISMRLVLKYCVSCGRR